MISVSDILKILDQVPVWKTLTALPKRLRDLEERVAKLEGRPAAKATDACPLCDAPMKVIGVQADPHFGDVGLQLHALRCTQCSHSETRQVDPNKS